MFAPSALRQARTFTIRLQPGFIATCASTNAAPFSTKTSTRPAQQQCTQRPSYRPSALALAIRHATSAASSSPAANSTSSSQQLTWNDFFALRKTRRRASQVTSGISAIGVAYAGLQVFIGGGYDGLLAASIGLDPMITTGLASAAMLTVGWLVGPFFSNAVFNVRNRAIAPHIAKVGLPLCSTTPFTHSGMGVTDEKEPSGEQKFRMDTDSKNRKNANSTTASRSTVSTRRPLQWRTQCRTTTARRSAAWQTTGGG